MRGLTRLRVRSIALAASWALLTLGVGLPATAAGPGVSAIGVGDDHACAVRTDGTVWCWGADQYGQLGDGTTGDAVLNLRTTPVQVRRGPSTLKGATKVALGALHSCALRGDGTVWCWGSDEAGQLGDGTTGEGLTHLRTTAVQVHRGSGHLTGVKQLAAGAYHTCALRTNGSVWCWGYDLYGELGDGTTGGAENLRTTAVRVRQGSGYLEGVIAIAAGSLHTCATRANGSVWCWGLGEEGQLGDGGSGIGHQRTMATHVRRGSGYLTDASAIAAGEHHTCVRRTDGSAWCWGYADLGQLGDGTTHLRTKPVRVLRGSGFLTGVTGIGAGGTHSCARRTDGSAWCWGWASDGQLGDGTTGDTTNHVRLKPVRVIRSTAAFTGVRKLEGGEDHTCALRTDHTTWCWGSNDHGQLGRGTADNDPHPYPLRVLFP